MLYICIPTHNEAPTIGLLLWRIRKVFQQHSREYEIIVYDDASSDATAETLRSYAEVLPLTVIGSTDRTGYTRALEACCRAVNERTRYPRRDALIVMQGDFTDAPEHIPDLARRFEGGADIVTAERGIAPAMPRAVRHLNRFARWLVRGRSDLGTHDPVSGFRLYRVSVIRDLLKRLGDRPLLSSPGAAANAELLLAAAGVARRLESVAVVPRYDLRQRATRVRLSAELATLFRLRRVARHGAAPTAAILLLAAAIGGATMATGQLNSAAPRREAVPFSPGERLVFDVRFGPLKVGTSTMEVRSLAEVRGRTAYHTRFTVRGGTFFYKVNDVLESWIDTATLSSLRFVKDLEEGSRDREQRYEIYPERQLYIETSAREPTEQPSVEQPLDDGSFIYFIRTVPLRIGETLEFNRYFRPDRNPVRIRILRRERITVPAGTFDAIVVRPSIKAKGIFAEGGQAEMWLSDDERRLVLQLKSRLSFGSLNLYLRSYTSGAP